MLMISQPETETHAVRIRLAGQIAGPWVTELERVTSALPGNSHVVTLDLAEVTFADEAGVALLNRLRAAKVRLVRCSPFVEELLRR